MNASDALALVADRLRAHAVVIEHSIPVYCEAEEYDLEQVLAVELAKGSLHIVVAAAAARYEEGAARAGVKGDRELVVSLAYLPGMTAPPVVVLTLSCQLAAWLHGYPETGSWLKVTEEAAMPDGADVSGRQITLKTTDVLRAER